MSWRYPDWDFESVVKHIDEYVYPLFTLAFAYSRWRSMSVCILIGVIYTVLFLNFKIHFVGISFASFFVADTVISQRMLRTASDSVRMYATIALTFCLIVFGIITVTGGLEPYEAAIIAVALYIVQARYRTQDVQLSRIPEIIATGEKEQPYQNDKKEPPYQKY